MTHGNTTNSEPLPLIRKILDWLQISAAVIVVACLFGFIWTRVTHPAEQNTTTSIANVKLLQVIGANPCWYGEAKASYTLVEFADYQCPPCRATARHVTALLNTLHKKVRFTFRNYPLKKLHPYAYPAAVAAEIARKHGCFWQMHDLLYIHQEELSDAYIEKTLKSFDLHRTAGTLDQKAAAQVIAQDITDGDLCGLKGTPTFVLCCPDGHILRLEDINQISDIVIL